MRKHVLALTFFVTLIGIGMIIPTANFKPIQVQSPDSQSFIMSAIGDNTEDYVDQLSDLHAPTDIGTHNTFADLQAFDSNYDSMTEANQGSAGNDVEDVVDSDATDVDSSPDVGTQGTFANAQDFGDTDYMTVQETDLGFAGVNENLDCNGYDSTFTAWTAVGTTPYLDAIDYNTNYIYTSGNGDDVGYFTFPSTSLTSGSATVTLYVYCMSVDGDDLASVYYNIGSGDVYTGIDVCYNTTFQYNAVTLGSLTVAEINALSIRFTSVRSPPGSEIRIDYIYINVFAPAVPDYEMKFEYEFTTVDFDEVNEEVCINVQTATQGTEELEVYEWDGVSAWSLLGTLNSDGWNNFTASYITSSTYYIEIRDNERTDEGTQSTWAIDSILLHVWTVPTLDYELDLEVGWTAADFDESNEELCIYPVTGGGWPAEDIKVDVWTGAWTNVIADLTPDQWNNVSISSYLTGTSFEIRFLGGTETGDTTQDTWEINAVLIHTWTPSYSPVIDQAPTLDNPSDTDNMYAQYIEYQITVYVSDQNGFADIDYLEIGLWNNTQTTEYCRFRYDEDTNAFTEEYDAGTYVSLNTGSSAATESGNDINATFYFTIDWDFPDSTDLDANCTVIDTQTESTTTWYEVNWDVETRLDYSAAPSIDDGSGTLDRGDLDGSFSLTGTVIYYQSIDDFPASAAVDVWVSASEYGTNVGPWSDLTLTSGAFDVTCYADDVIGEDTYTVKVVEEGAGSGGTDLYYTNSATDTYIADRLIIAITDPTNQRINIGENATGIVVSAIYDYDDSAFDGTLTINNTQFVYGTAQRQDYTVSSASGGTHGVSFIGVNDVTYCIWDSLSITITDPPNQRINTNANASGIIVSAIYDYDGSPYDGTLTLNNTQFLYGTAQIQYYTVQTASGDTYGITSISSNDVTFCIWDSLTITITDPADQRQNINVNATGILVSAIRDYDGSAFDGTLTLNNTQYIYATAQRQDYTVLSVSGGSFGITAISSNDVTYFIWDSLTVTISDPTDSRINIDTAATGITATAVYDYDGSVFDGTLTLNNTQFTYSTAQIQWYTVASAGGDTEGITVINANDVTWCIWDSLTVTLTDPSDQHIDVGTAATGVTASAVYDYDGAVFDGTLTLNNTQFTYATAQIQWYTVASASGDTEGITAINVNDLTWCIWDSLTISLSDPADQRINIGTAATGIVASAVYDYDGSVYDGSLTLNNTQFTYATAQIQWYTVSSATGDSYEITVINTNDLTYCVWDSITITITDPADQRQNINTNATGIFVSAIYDYDGSPFDGTLTLNNTQFSYGVAQRQDYTVQTVSGSSYGITAISTNDVTFFIWDSLTITINDPSNQRINIDTAATGILASAVYDYDGSVFDGVLTLNNSQFTYSTAQIQWYTVTSASGDTEGITSISTNDVTWCIWDSLTIFITDPTDQQQNINANATGIYVSAVYDYDGSAFDGSLTLNNTQFSYSTAQRQDYTVQSVSGGAFGITAISSNDVTYFIWDSLIVSITDPGSQRINTGANASGIVVTAIHAYDSSSFDGTLTLNNTQFIYATAQRQDYTVLSATGGTEGITAISVNDVTYCIWDSLTITITNPVNQRIDINTNATGIFVSAVYDYDGSSFDGTLTLNNTQFSYATTQRQDYTVQTVSGGAYGITTISVNDLTYCIWDSLTITMNDPSNPRININTAATGIGATAVYDYDGSPYDGTLTLNNTQFTYSTAQIQWYTVASASGDSIGISAINVNDLTWCIWDSLTITVNDPSDQRIDVSTAAIGIAATAVYDYDGAAYDGTLTLNNTQFTYATAQIQWYTVDSASGDTFGITEISTNDVTYCVWDSLSVSITDPPNQRININTNASGIVVSAVYDYDGSPFDGTLTLNNTQFIYATAQRQDYTVASASADTYEITVISSNDVTFCIWDSLTIAITDPIDQRIDINANASGIIVSAVYDYDGSPFDGTFTLNNTQFVYGATQRQDYTVSSVSGDSYGITAIAINDVTYCIWDRLLVTISVDDSTPNDAVQANFSLAVVFDYDDTVCTTYQIVIQRNGTWWHSFTDANKSYFVDTQSDTAYTYTTRLVTSESTYTIVAFVSNNQQVVWSAIPNNAPANDADPVLTNPDDGSMLARYNFYIITSNVSDADGFNDIQYVELTLYDNTTTTPLWTVRYTVSGDTFSVELGGAYIQLGMSSYASMAGNDLDITWYIKIDWAHVDMLNTVPHQFVTDGKATDSDFSFTTWDIETRLDYSSVPALSDDRGDVSTVDLVATGSVTYLGSTRSPLANETDVWVIHDVSGTWSGDLSAGSFSISGIGSSASVRLNTYTFKIVIQGSGAGGTDLYHSASLTDTYITDRIEVYQTGVVDSRINISSDCEVWWRARYEYTGTDIQSGLTLTLNGSRTLAWDAINLYWRWQESSGSPSSAGFDVVSGSESTYGITALAVTTSVQQVIWDAVVITISDPTSQRINIGENATGILVSAVYAFDGAPFDGILTLNNTNFIYATAQKQDYTVLSVSGDSYDITAILSNDVTYCIWDSLSITITDPINQRQNVNANATGIFVTAIYDYDGTPFDGILTLNNTQFSYATAQRQDYTVQSVSGSGYGITAISTNDVTYFIWDSLTVSITDPGDQRININTAVTGITASAIYDYDGSVFDGTITLNNTQFTYSTAQIQWYTADSAGGDTLGITVISSNDLTWCIWDSLTVTINDPTDSRINTNTAATGITATAVYDYDGSAFDGTLALNNSQFTYSTPQIQWYTVESASGDTEGITAINVNDLTWCIWDQLNIVIGVDDATLLNGVQANFSMTVTFLFDGVSCTTYQVAIDRNATWWHSFIDANTTFFVDANTNMTYFYNASMVSSESTYGITSFTTNTLQVVWSLAPNEIPVSVSGPILTNADDTDNLYARYRYYIITTSVSDPDGYIDIDYVELTLYDDTNTTPLWTVRYTVVGDAFSIELGGAFIQLGASSLATMGSTDLDISWYIKIDWDHVDMQNVIPSQFVTDGKASATSYSATWDVETRLDYSIAPLLSNHRGDVNTADLIASGSVTYYGSSFSPLANETDIWVVHDQAGTWSGDLVANNFSITGIGSSAIVRLNNYTIKVVAEGAGSGGTDLYYTSSLFDTFITDRIEIYEAGTVDGQIDINTDCEVWWRARYEYDSTEIQSGLTIVLNGSRTLTWDAGNLYWSWQETSVAPASVLFDVFSASESTYGLTQWSDSTSIQQVIWDSLVITISDPTDQRINVGANASGIVVTAIYAFHGTPFDGSLILNNTNFQYATPQKQGYTVIAATGDSYGITAIGINDVTFCIWDRVRVASIDADELYHDPNDDVVLTVELQYEYDGSSVLTGTFAIASYPLTHVGAGVWEAQVTIGSYQAIDFDDLTTCNATLYGISGYNMDSNAVTVYWDRLEFYSVSVDDDRISVGDSTNVEWSVRLENAGIPITSGVTAQMTGAIDLVASAGVFTAAVTASEVGSVDYSIIAASLGEIDQFTQSASDAAVIWDMIRVTSITATEISVDAGTAVEIHVTLVYEFDSTAVTSGEVRLSDGSAQVPMVYNSAEGYWSTTVTKTTAGNYTFEVNAVVGDTHGITVINTDGFSVEVQWVAAPGFVLDTMTLMIIGGGAGIGILGLALVASRRRRGGAAADLIALEPSDLGASEPVEPEVSAEPETIEPEVEAIPEEIEPAESVEPEPDEIEETPEAESGVVDEVAEPEEVELPPFEEELGEPEVIEEAPGPIEEPITEPEVEPEYPDYAGVPEEFIEPEPVVDLSTLTKKELLEMIPDDIRETTSPKELRRLTKQELISLIESFRE